jgi:hypothetical protein
MRGPYFRERISKKSIDHLLITNENNTFIDPEIFQLILEYIYSDQCPWLTFSHRIQTRDEHEYQAYLTRMKNMEDDMVDDHRFFTRARQQIATNSGSNQSQHGTKSKKKKKAGRIFFFFSFLFEKIFFFRSYFTVE